jgi:hypothetical protein
MADFEKLQENLNIQELIKTTFEADLAIAGGWGYTKEGATIIEAVPENMTLAQLEHMITSIRAHLEMNITQSQEDRYGAINVNERAREKIRDESGIFDKINYEVTGIKEDLYNAFSKEYKENYGKESFDLNEHFARREKATLIRDVVHYFEVSRVQ